MLPLMLLPLAGGSEQVSKVKIDTRAQPLQKQAPHASVRKKEVGK